MRQVRTWVVAVPIVAGLLQAPSAGAQGEPDHTATLTRANPKFTWESSGSGISDPSGPQGPLHCPGAPFRCDYTLLHVKRAGGLALILDGDGVIGDPTGEGCGTHPECMEDIDGYLYRSNAAGEPLREPLTGYDCATLSSSERCRIVVGPGFYLVEVVYYHALEVHYTGTARIGALRPG